MAAQVRSGGEEVGRGAVDRRRFLEAAAPAHSTVGVFRRSFFRKSVS